MVDTHTHITYVCMFMCLYIHTNMSMYVHMGVYMSDAGIDAHVKIRVFRQRPDPGWAFSAFLPRAASRSCSPGAHGTLQGDPCGGGALSMS